MTKCQVPEIPVPGMDMVLQFIHESYKRMERFRDELTTPHLRANRMMIYCRSRIPPRFNNNSPAPSIIRINNQRTPSLIVGIPTV